jgi:hypothetical protein
MEAHRLAAVPRGRRGEPLAAIARALSVGRQAVHKWAQQYRRRGVAPPPSAGAASQAGPRPTGPTPPSSGAGGRSLWLSHPGVDPRYQPLPIERR